MVNKQHGDGVFTKVSLMVVVVIVMVVVIRVAKCHGYDGYIRVKILASWGKSLGGHTILQNEAFFGGDMHNRCEISLSSYILHQFCFGFGAKIVAI